MLWFIINRLSFSDFRFELCIESLVSFKKPDRPVWFVGLISEELFPGNPAVLRLTSKICGLFSLIPFLPPSKFDRVYDD